MTATRYLLILLRSLCAMLWAGSAAAVPVLLADRHISAILTDPLVLTIAGLIATAAGVTTLAMRINTLLAQQDPAHPQPLVKPWLFAMAHIGGSYLASIAALLIASIQKLEADSALLLVLVAAFLGSKFLEMVAEKYFPITRLLPPAAREAP